MDEEVARNLQAQLQAELEDEERISRLKEEKANIALLESLDNTQAMMDVDFQLAQQMQTEEQEQLSIEEKPMLFVKLLEKRKKHFVALGAQEKRSKPPTKAQKRNTMSTYLKNLAGYKHNQMKNKSYNEIQEMFDKEMKRVNTFVDINIELVKSSETRTEGSSKRKAEMKKHIEIVKYDEVAIDVIPLAIKPPVIVKYKIVKEGKFVYFQLIRADESSKRYLSMIKMLQNIDREDLETLWKLVKAKHGNTRPEDEYERVLWGDIKDGLMWTNAARGAGNCKVAVCIVVKTKQHVVIGYDANTTKEHMRVLNIIFYRYVKHWIGSRIEQDASFKGKLTD
ncbi:hypothetical protein Tco_0712838 [Tanacetum coccineum]